jgi:hypothetical protein
LILADFDFKLLLRMLTQQDIEAQLSYAYLHAVVSHAGFDCQHATPSQDKQGIDAIIAAYGSFPDSIKTQVTINVQLKATIEQPVDNGTHLSYFVKEIKRYDKLRDNHCDPARILVVLFLPPQHADWLSHSENELILKNCAYWVSLRNAPGSENDTGKTVKIPKEQMLNVENLKTLVKRLAQGDIPSYLLP